MMNNRFRILPLMVLLVFIAGTLAAQSARVEVSRSELSVGETLTYTVRTTGYVQIAGAPTTTSDTIAIERSQSTEQRIINGQREEAHTWRFTALKQGPFVIHPPRVSINGQMRPLDDVNGNVTAAERVDTSDLGRVAFVEADATVRARFGDRYFLATEVSNPTPTVGEVFFVTTYAHWRAGHEAPRMATPRINRLGASHAFVYPGTRSVRFYNTPLQSNYLVMIDGQRYFRQSTHTIPVVAMRSGRHEVESVPVDMQFGFNSFPFQVPAFEIDVQPAPSRIDGTVTRFVGRPTMSLFPDREEAKQGELLSVTLRVSGEGYWEPVDLTELPDVRGMRLVDREVNFRIDNYNKPFVSTKEFYLVYQLTDSGNLLFPDLGFTVIDPESGNAERVEVPGFELFVERSESASYALRPDGSPANGAIQRGEARSLGGDGLLFIDTGPLTSRTYDAASRPIGLRAGYWAAHAAPLLLLGAGGLLVAARRRRDADPAQRRRRELRENVRNKMSDAMSNLAAEDASAFHAALAGALESAFALRTGESAGGFTREELAHKLRAVGITHADAVAVSRLLERCDSMRYAPTASASAMQDDLAEAERLVELLAPERVKGGQKP